VSENAIKEVGGNVCLKCNKTINAEDFVTINPPSEVQDEIFSKLLIKKQKSKKKSVNLRQQTSQQVRTMVI